ncbi:MAG TPA: hypothetical protein V6C97_12550 [Oculatellaceae cyanobacterium]
MSPLRRLYQQTVAVDIQQRVVEYALEAQIAHTAPATTVTSACGFHKAASFCCIHGLDSVFLFSLFSLLSSLSLSLAHTLTHSQRERERDTHTHTER